VTGPVARPCLSFATVGALALALLLTACGLKGPLERPPSQAATPAQAAQVNGQPQSTLEGEATPQPATKRRFFLDWLLD
jgi:predicted small lipoprotein YifL